MSIFKISSVFSRTSKTEKPNSEPKLNVIFLESFLKYSKAQRCAIAKSVTWI